MPQSIKVNPKAVALSPNGVKLEREHILEKLGLDPHTPPDAWLAVFACGVNMSALKRGDLQELVTRGVVDKTKLDAATLKKLTP